MIKTVIVDDEPRARSALNSIIENYCDTLKVVGVAENVLTGIKIIERAKPDLVFLDIRMPELDGFKLLEFMEDRNFQVIFTTAYEKYALNAHKFNALGYLLKPIDIEELQSLVQKAEGFIKNDATSEQDWSKYINVNHESQTLLVPKSGGVIHMKFEDILYIKSKGRDSVFFCNDGREFTSSINLKTVEGILYKTTFLRIHKSIIVNLFHIKRFSKGKESYIMLYNDVMLEVGKTYKDKLNLITSLFPR